MDKFTMGVNIFEGVISLVHFAESFFSGEPKSGEQKKNLVLNTAKILIHSADNIATGGAKNTWNKIDAILPNIVDTTANILYPPNK